MSKRKIRNIITSIIFLIVAITAIYFGDIEVNENILENTTVSYNLGEIPEYNGKIFVNAPQIFNFINSHSFFYASFYIV